MPEINIYLPSKPKIVFEEENSGVYEIDGLYPGYGHTLGNSLRRILLSSLPGAAITSIKIEGVNHEFATIEGIKEDVITIILNLKRIRMALLSEEPQMLNLKIKGERKVTAADIEAPGQVQILNKDAYIAEITSKNTVLDMEILVEKGLGYVPKELLHKERVDIGTITLDAIFTPIRRVNYEVENMRVGDRTDFNRVKLFIETDGTFSPRNALEKSIRIMIEQLKAIIGFQYEEPKLETLKESDEVPDAETPENTKDKQGHEIDQDALKTRIEMLPALSRRTVNSLSNANIRTLGGLARKREEDILAIEGIGQKGLEEIKNLLEEYGINFKG